MHLFTELAIGGTLLVTCFLFQALCFELILRKIPFFERRVRRFLPEAWKSYVLMVVVIAVSAVIITQIWLWGLLYWIGAVLPDFESALYFSTTTFTTVGYGDVHLEQGWRMIGAVESMNGFLIFSWAAAFLWEVINNLYRKEGDAIDRSKNNMSGS